MIKKRYLTFVGALLLLSGGMSANAQSLGDIILRPVVVTQKGTDNDFYKGLLLYMKQQYVASIIALEKAVLSNALAKQERDIADFIIAMSRAKMMKANSLIIMESYVNSASNPVLRNAAMLQTGVLLMELNDIESAKEILSGIRVKSLDKQARTLYYYAQGYIKLTDGEREAAYADFEKCLGDESIKKEIARYYMAYIDYLNGDLDKAVAVFEELASNPDYYEANIYIMQIRFMQGDFKYVISKGESVLEMPINNQLRTETLRLIGESYFNIGNYVQAVNHIDKFKSMGGSMTRELFYQMGYSYYMQNMYKKSIAEFIKIIDGDDALAQNAYYHLADAYLKEGDKNGAMQAFSMASSLLFDEKMSEDALYNYARLTYESGGNNLYSKKIDVLKKYIDTYPKGNRANELREYLLTLYINGSNFDAAMSELSKIKNPNDEIKKAVQRLNYQKATEYFNNGKYSEAVELFNKSLSYPIAPKYVALSSFWKAESMFKQGIFSEQVVNLYRNYLRVAQPSMREYKMAYYNIGYVYFNNEKWADAVTAFEKFISLYKNNDVYLEDAYLRLGDAMFARKMYSAARLYYKKSSDAGVSNADYADFQTAISEGLMGRNDLKIETLKSISDSGKSQLSDRATIELAGTYIKTGKYNEGVTVLEKMTSRKIVSPYTPAALLELGVAYSNKGDDDKALKTYQRLITTYAQSSEAKDALVAVKAIYVSKGEIDRYFAYVDALGVSSGVDASEKESLTFDAIQRQFIDGNHKKVIELADSYNKEFEGGVHKIDVLYYLSESLIATDNDRAVSQMDELLAMPNSQYTNTIYKNAVDLFAKKSLKEKQLAVLTMIYRNSVNPSDKKDALESLMELAVKMGDDKMMSESADIVFTDKDASAKALDYARYARGRITYNQGDYKAAIDDLQQVKIPASVAEGMQARFLIADALFKLGDMVSCEKKIIEISNIETPHQYWVARSFILYGDLYAKKGDLFQAKSTYQSILDGYEKKDDGILETAKKRIETLSEIDAGKKTE